MKRLIPMIILVLALTSQAAFAQITTTLQGLDINTVAFRIAVPADTLAEPMRTRATNLLKSALNWKEPDAAASTSTLVLDLSTDPVAELPGKVLKQWSLRLVEGTTIRGFSQIVYTYDRHGGMGIAPAPTQDDLNNAIDDFIGVFIQAYQIGNGLPITPPVAPPASGTLIDKNGSTWTGPAPAPDYTIKQDGVVRGSALTMTLDANKNIMITRSDGTFMWNGSGWMQTGPPVK